MQDDTLFDTKRVAKPYDTFAGLGNDLSDDTDSADMSGRLTTPEAVRAFLHAGNATITIRSVGTDKRFTYKVSKPKDPRGSVSHFVALLNGPDNESNYQYMGFLAVSQAGTRYVPGKKSKVSLGATSAVAFAWFYQNIVAAQRPIPANLEIWHSGSCGRCGRKLTVPSSVALGLGPECADKMEGM